MVINFESNKNCSSYRDLVLNPQDRQSIKNFNKNFDANLVTAAVKTYNKMQSATNASVYNLTVAQDNKIQLKSGTADKSSLILKVRVQGSYRKFFYYDTSISGNTNYCLKKDWIGQFDQIQTIYVYDVNKHDYKK